MAFIQKQIVPISLQAGLNQKVDPYQVQIPNLLELENAQFSKIGQLNKRAGYNILTNNIFSGTNIESAYAIDSYENELNLFDNQSLYAYSPSSEAWVNRGPAISLINSVRQITRLSAAQQLNPDCASLNNIDVFVWEDSTGGCRYSVLDNQTNTYVISNQLLINSINGSRPKAVVFNGLIYIFYTNQSILYYQIINPNNPNVITVPEAAISDGGINFRYDLFAATVGGVPLLHIVYFTLIPSLKIVSLTQSNMVIGATTVATGSSASQSTTYQSCSVIIDSQNAIWIAWSTGADVRVISYGNGGPSFPSTVVDTVVCPLLTCIEYISPGQLQLVYEIYNSNPSNESVKSVTCNPVIDTISTIGTLRSVGIASKPFNYNGNNFINLAFQSSLQSTYFGAFLTFQPFTIMSKVSPGTGGGLRTNGMVAQCNQISPGVFLWANLTQGRFLYQNNTDFALLGVQATVSDFTNINKFNSATFSDNLLFVGGILQSYDGVSVSEQNFHIYPEGVTAAQSTTMGGQLTTTAQYQYQVVYSWTNRLGQIQYSTPSPTITVQLTSTNNTVTLTIPTLRLTAKQGVVIQIYRTIANGGNSGNPVFYVTTSLLTPPDPITGLGGGGILNNPNVNSVTFIDEAADTSIQNQQPIYTQGGILPNAAPPSCSMISLFPDRVMLSGLEDPNAIWFSKMKQNNSSYNTVPAEFSASNVISISEVGGPITAIALMDQNLFIFKENAIFIQVGPGPNNAGLGNSFGDAQLLTNQYGCTNPNSIIVFGQGIMFQTPNKGMWLVDHNLSPPQYVGAGVDDVALKYQVSSATLDPQSNNIIFTTFDGPAMIYDAFAQQWATYTDHQAVDSCNFQNLFTMVKENGAVYQQNTSIFYDGYVGTNNPIPYSMTITTPWISLANILGYQRIFKIFLLGTYKGPHTLNVEIGYNFDNGFYQTGSINTTLTAGLNVWGADATWGASSPWGGTWSPYIYQINPAIQRCTSFRLRIRDSQTPPYNEGYALSSLLLEVGVMPDGIRVPVTNKINVSR